MKRQFKHKMICVVFLSLVCVSVAGIAGIYLADAFFDESTAVHVVSDEIENSTLIIGTHLIYIGSLTDEIYELAEESESDSNQFARYYKSELSSGTWYNITDAVSLTEITTGGIPVSKEEVEALWLTHHTRSDGKTYDLRTGEEVCIYDINDPYTLEALEELEPVKRQYENLENKENPSYTDGLNKQNVRELLQKELQNDTTKQCDEQLSALQVYLDILTGAQADAESLEEVQKVMKSLDASRRAEIFTILSETELEDLIKKVENPKDGEHNVYVDYDLLSAIGESMDNVESSLTEQRAEMLDEGESVLSRTRHRLSMELIQAAQQNNYSSCDEAVEKLIYLSRIEENSIVDADRELGFLAGDLFPAAREAYWMELSSGTGDEYEAALASKSARAVLNKLLKNQKNDASIARGELQFILQAEFYRQTDEEAKELVQNQIAALTEFRGAVKKDAFSSYANESIDEYEDWLLKRLEELLSSLDENELDALLAEKEALMKKKLEALDNNDLAEAERLSALLDAKQQDIEAKEKELTNILQSSTATAQEKAQAAARLSGSTSAANILSMQKEAIDDIRKGNMDSVVNAVDGISSLMQVNPDTALSAMQEVYKELTKQTYLYDSEDSTEEEGDAEGEGGTEGKGDTEGEGDAEGKGEDSIQRTALMQQVLQQVEDRIVENAAMLTGRSTSEELSDMIKEEMGKSFEELSDKEQAVAVAAVSQYAKESKDSNAKRLAASMAAKAAGNGNAYLFTKLNRETSVYVPLENIGKCFGYRYLFNDSQKEGILQKGASYYIFRAFGNEVVRQDKKTEEMEQPAGYQAAIYIPYSYAQEQFDCVAEYIEESSYGVLYGAAMEEKVLELLDVLFSREIER